MIIFWIVMLFYSAWRSYDNFSKNRNTWGYVMAAISGVSLMEVVTRVL